MQLESEISTYLRFVNIILRSENQVDTRSYSQRRFAMSELLNGLVDGHEAG